MGVNVNAGQVTINVSDTIPPANLATIDKDGLIGNAPSKEQFNDWKEEVEDKVDKISTSGIKGEATPTSSPTAYDPTTYPKGLYEKWEVKTAGTYTNFKDASNQPIVVTSTDLTQKLVYINMTNGVAKLDPISIPGAAIDDSFEVSNITKAQNAKNINHWLVNDVEGGESDDVNQTIEEVGDFFKNIGITLNGDSSDSLNYDIISCKSNDNPDNITNQDKYITKAHIRLTTGGQFKFCVGTWDGSKYIVRWLSDVFTGVSGWNAFDFTNIKLLKNEIIGVTGVAGSSAQIAYGFGATGNRFSQLKTDSNSTWGPAGSYYALWFELNDIDIVTIPSDGKFNIAKSVSKVVSDYSLNGYTGVEKLKGESVVSVDSDATAGYAINKIELDTSYKLEKLEIRTVTAGTYQIAIGFIEQAGKFIEKKVVTKSLTAGLNTVTIDPVILEVGDYVGFKFPSKYPVNNTPSVAGLWASSSYTGALTQVAGKSLPIKLFLKEYISTPIATKSDLNNVTASVNGLQQIFTHEGKKVGLTFNSDGTVEWSYIEGYSNILHLGNSIAKHALTSYWWGSWGMAASELSKDYVHRFLAKMQVLKPAAATSVLNIAEWEVNPSGWNKSTLDPYLIGKDLICIRLGENATYNGTFKTEFASLISYIKSKNSTAKILIGGVFWADSNKDTAMSEVASENSLPFVSLSHLDIPANKSYMGAQVKGDDGQWHTVNNTGVAIHPGDLGMDAIATELFNALGL